MVLVIPIFGDHVIAIPDNSPIAFGQERWITLYSLGRPELPYCVWKEFRGLRVRTLFCEKDVKHLDLKQGSAIAYVEDIASALHMAGKDLAAVTIERLYTCGSLYIFSPWEYVGDKPLPHC